MGKSIDDYRSKRDFGRTPEPEAAPPGERGDAPVFVVHRHDASRLHYDLRLEMEGVLRSWAVPKGFSYDPDDKHLAVRTEDHPLEYEHFDGVIPKGQYGAGTMTIWDHGRYEVLKADSGPAAVADGELKLLMRGKKLRGEWHMVRTKKDKTEELWLLFKSRDRYAGTPRDSALGIDLTDAAQAPLPEDVEPMAIGAAREPFTDPDWLFEMKFAGRRVLARKSGEDVALVGAGLDGVGDLDDELRKIRAENALVDGVLVCADDSERPSRALLDERLAGGNERPLQLYAFDLLYYDEFDLRALPLVDRKAALRAVLPPLPGVLFVDHVPGNGESLCEAVAAAGLPAVVAKRADAPYVDGAAGPSDAWREIATGADPAGEAPAVSEALKTKRKEVQPSRVKLVNLEKVFWPAEGFTKGDLIAYYERVADVLLPYLRERPVHMNRFPDGIEGKSFYQKEAKEDFPDWIATVPIDSEHRDEPTDYPVCNDRDTLLFLVNRGSIDLHPWMSRRTSQDSPDWAVIDLDPKGAPFPDVVRIAQASGRILHDIGLRPLLKTSGKTGLHVFVPLEPGYTYDHSRMFCEGVARMVVRELPDIATVERATGSREGKVYVDFLQNRRGQTVVPPYAVRPVRGATVSTPLAWEELEGDLQIAHFTIQTLPPRLDRLGDLFRGALDDPQDLMPAIEKLQELL